MPCTTLQHAQKSLTACIVQGGLKQGWVGLTSGFNWTTGTSLTAVNNTTKIMGALPALAGGVTTPLFRFQPNNKGYKFMMERANRFSLYKIDISYVFNMISGTVKQALQNDSECCALVFFFQTWDDKIFFVGMEWNGTSWVAFNLPLGFDKRTISVGDYAGGSLENSHTNSGTIEGETSTEMYETTLTTAQLTAITAP